jgi:hypothetical protein
VCSWKSSVTIRPNNLASKLRVLREAGLKRIVVCVDESLACDHTDFRASAVLPYRRRVDAAALIAAAERVIAENDACLGASEPWTASGDVCRMVVCPS